MAEPHPATANPGDPHGDAAPWGAPRVVSLAMGYGHLRAAHALADELGVEVLHADRPPLADTAEGRLWAAARQLYEWTSRTSQVPWVGRPLRWLLDLVTAIPDLHPGHDLSHPTRPVRLLARLIDRGLGLGLARRLTAEGRPLLTTYFAPAVAVDDHRRAGRDRGPAPAEAGSGEAPRPAPVYCVVTDVDLARAWVGRSPAATGVCYLVPSHRAVERLAAYGVPAAKVERTGFPLPGELLGGPDLPVLRRRLAERLVRLDPAGAFRSEQQPEVAHFLGPLPEPAPASPPPPVRITYVVGGAGAQADFAEPLLRSLAQGLGAGRYRLSLVAGTRPEVAEAFHRQVRAAGMGDPGTGVGDDPVEVVLEDDVESYFRRFNHLLSTTDLLWTKPSELTFFGALGLPLVFTRPVGAQERHNRRWAEQRGVGLRGPAPHQAAERLEAWLADGTLASAAWNGFLRLPKQGLYRIVARVAGHPADGAAGGSPAAGGGARPPGVLPPLG